MTFFELVEVHLKEKMNILYINRGVNGDNQYEMSVINTRKKAPQKKQPESLYLKSDDYSSKR